MSTKSYTILAGSRVLVTGANGYIASHVVDQLLQLGYIVRGTVRAAKPWLDEYFKKEYGDAMFETASDLTFGSDPEAVIPWVVKATLNILEVAAKQPTVKQVVLVSSSSASYMISDPKPEGRTVDKDTWNEEAVKAAWDPITPEKDKGVAVYAASKTEGERQAWKWMQEHRPHFTFNTVLPCFNVGRILHPNIFGSTMGWTRKLLEGDPSALSKFPEQWYVDVEDVARLCAIGLLDPKVKAERLFAFAEIDFISYHVFMLERATGDI